MYQGLVSEEALRVMTTIQSGESGTGLSTDPRGLEHLRPYRAPGPQLKSALQSDYKVTRSPRKYAFRG